MKKTVSPPEVSAGKPADKRDATTDANVGPKADKDAATAATPKGPSGPPTTMGPSGPPAATGATPATGQATAAAPKPAGSPGVTANAMMAEIQKVVTELQQLRQGQKTMETQLADVVKTLTNMAPRLEGLEKVVGSVNSRMGPMSQNVLDTKANLDKEMKDMQKAVFSISNTAKNDHDEVMKEVEGWAQEILKKVTQLDYNTCTSLTRHVEQGAAETLAACHFQQAELAEIKGCLREVQSQVEANSSETHLIREYCERPVPAVPAAPSYTAPVLPSNADQGRPPLRDPSGPASRQEPHHNSWRRR